MAGQSINRGNSAGQLRAAALQALQLRPLTELAGGAAIGLLALSASLGPDVLGGRLPAIDTARMLELLLCVPLLHGLAITAWQALLRPRLAAHFAGLLQGSQLLLWVVSGEFPADYARLAGLLGIGRTARQDFGPRLQLAARHWQALCRAAVAPPFPPNAHLGWQPLAGALLWALAAWALHARYAFSPLLYPVLFLALWFHLQGVLSSIARDEFTLALCTDLDTAAATPGA